MVWKIVIIAVAMVLSSIIIAGAIIGAQVLANIPNIGNELDQWSGDSGQDSQQGSPMIEEGKVSIVDNSGSNSYNPNPIEIKVGETVTWVNNDSAAHTATSSNSTFDSDILRKGETFSFTFDKEGEYPYFCALHPKMEGKVVVTEGS